MQILHSDVEHENILEHIIVIMEVQIIHVQTSQHDVMEQVLLQHVQQNVRLGHNIVQNEQVNVHQ